MPRLAVIAGAIALCAAPASAQDVQAGVDAWQRADYEAAVEIWRPLAESGHADAAFNLGQAYRLGRGVPVDLAAAQRWLERAARQGHLDAQTTLGLLLFRNGDTAEGVRWLKIAADRAEPRAMLMLGTALFNGDGVTRDPVLAYAYVSRAAAQGLEPARSTLAEMNEILTLEQREKGIAAAREMAAGRHAGGTPAAPPAAPPVVATAPPAAPVPAPRAAEPPPAAAPAIAAAPPPVEPAPATAAPKQSAPAPARVATPSASASAGGWRIQLGAFSQRASAEALFRRLSASAPVAGKRSYLIPAGRVIRLQVGPFESRAAAASACASLRPKGQACFPVGPQ